MVAMGLRRTYGRAFLSGMGKGEETRAAVLDRAVEVARRVGLSGLTIGTLAEQADLSKSGLFGHFRSKEALQIQVLEHARASFEQRVGRPAIRAPRGEPRVRALFDAWVAWDDEPGGCPFMAAATEYDDRPGTVRDHLVRDERDLFDMIATVVRSAVGEGHFGADTDAEQFAQDFYGVILARHHTRRLLGDARADERARRALDNLIRAATPGPADAPGGRWAT
jgi:AcrR family transcriptional regulator